MNKDIAQIIGEVKTLSLKEKLFLINKEQLAVSDIVLAINEETEVNREAMSIIALSLGLEELSERIDKANTIIKSSRVKAFLKAFAGGRAKLYLAATSLDDKIALATALDINSSNPEITNDFDDDLIRRASLALEAAAKNDILKEANRLGLGDLIKSRSR